MLRSETPQSPESRIHLWEGFEIGGLGDVVDRLLDVMLVAASCIGFVIVVGSLNRWVQHGWHPQHLIHLGVYLAILAGCLLGRRLPRRARVACVLIPLWANGVANLVWHGLAGTGMLFMSVVCSLAIVLSGLRAALVLFGACVLLVLTIGAGMCEGLLPIAAGADLRLRSPTEWVAQGSAFAGLVVGCLTAFNAVQNVLRQSTARLEQRTAELEREIAERHRVEQQLSEREQRYRLLAANSRDVVFTFDMAQAFTYVSPSAIQLFDYSPEELLRMRVSDWLTDSSRERFALDFAERAAVAGTGSGVLPLLEYECVRRDGTTFWGELRAAFTRDEDGTPNGVQGALRDISERRAAEAQRAELEAQLQEAEKLRAIGQLAGGIAHDFNNQLAGIMGYAELLQAARSDDELVRSFTDSIMVPARRAADLTGKLLAFARRGKYHREPVDLHTIVRDTIAMIERSIDDNVTVVEHLSARRTWVLGDPTLLQSAVLYVALNARDAMPNGGTLTFATEERWDPATAGDEAQRNECGSSPRIVLRVHDTGHGMDEATARRAFEPFFTTKPVGHGTGMGLAAVHGTMHSHGGTVELESTPGQGTTVSLSLPLVADPSSEDPESGHRAANRCAAVEPDCRDRLAAGAPLGEQSSAYIERSRPGTQLGGSSAILAKRSVLCATLTNRGPWKA